MDNLVITQQRDQVLADFANDRVILAMGTLGRLILTRAQARKLAQLLETTADVLEGKTDA